MNDPTHLADQLEAFEDMRQFAHRWYPEAKAVLMAWSARHESAAVVGLLGADGHELEVTGERLVLLSTLLSRAVSKTALALVFPDANYSTGQVLFLIEAARPIPELLALRLLQDLTAGERVTDEHLRLGIRLLAAKVLVPTGFLRLRRGENGHSFGIVEFANSREGGTVVAGEQAVGRLEEPWVGEALQLFADELGQRVDSWRTDANHPEPELTLALG